MKHIYIYIYIYLSNSLHRSDIVDDQMMSIASPFTSVASPRAGVSLGVCVCVCIYIYVCIYILVIIIIIIIVIATIIILLLLLLHYMYVYIYICIHTLLSLSLSLCLISSWRHSHSPASRRGRDKRGANLRTKILDFRGCDSSVILISRGGILMSIGNFPETLSQQILVTVGIINPSREIRRGKTQGNHLSNTTCLTLVFFKCGK